MPKPTMQEMIAAAVAAALASQSAPSAPAPSAPAPSAPAPVTVAPVKPVAILTDAAMTEIADTIATSDTESDSTTVLDRVVLACSKHAHGAPIGDAQIDALMSKVAVSKRFQSLRGDVTKPAPSKYRSRMSDWRTAAARYFDIKPIETALAAVGSYNNHDVFKCLRLIKSGKATDATSAVVAMGTKQTAAPPADWTESSKRIGKLLRACIDMPHQPDGFEIAVRTLAATWRIDMPAKKSTK